MAFESRVPEIVAYPLQRRLLHILLIHASFALTASTLPTRAWAIDFFDGRVQIHGYAEEQFGMISPNFNVNNFYVSQMASILNVELEMAIAPNGWGPFDNIRAYTRLQVRYDCIWTKLCGLSSSTTFWGDRADRAPANFTNAYATGYSGVLLDPINNPPIPLEPNGRILPITEIPPFTNLVSNAGPAEQAAIQRTFGPVLDMLFATKKVSGTRGPATFPLGPWNTGVTIVPIAALGFVPDVTPALPLRPMVPNAPIGTDAYGLYVPSAALRAIKDQFGAFDTNYTQNQMAWNYTASQDTYEFKEGYLHFEALDGRLWFRLGKQLIVWGKTELFRNQDQFNPQDLGLTTLGSLEETRVPLWAARGVYSFYNVGPLEDVRFEVALDLGNFQPTDFGRCGSPYTIWLFCAKGAGLVAHGVAGFGLAGEIRPPLPYDNIKGLQGGARLEWRWDRFSFALTDYYGYSQFPTANNFNGYDRNVNPFTGYPLDSRGRTFGPDPFNINPSDPVITQQALNFNSGNLQLFNLVCSATQGLNSAAGLNLGNQCALTAFGSQAPAGFGLTIANALSFALAGTPGIGQLVINTLMNTVDPAQASLAPQLVHLNPSPTAPLGAQGTSQVLTIQQQALLGCGPFYGTICHNQGIDLFNTEASALLQAFPNFEQGGPVATRFVNGVTYTLPGACGPFNCHGRTYNPLIDGCVNSFMNGSAPPGTCSGATLTNLLSPFNPGPGRAPIVFNSVMDALSYNFLQVLTVLSKANDPLNKCNILLPQTCSLVSALFAGTGTQRPDFVVGGNGIFGRRDFLWQAGSQLNLQYPKRNILGFSTDFAHDATKTNWGIEFSWSNADQFPNGDTFSGYSTLNTLNLTISMDRPTFVNFLNENRTLFFNTQWFFRYIIGYQGQNWMGVEGPASLLGTFTVSTGYFQDRLLPTMTLVHDVGSTSGAAIMGVTYRYSEAFSLTFNVATFYGSPHLINLPLQQPLIQNNGPGFAAWNRYDGLSALAESDQFQLRLRYTF